MDQTKVSVIIPVYNAGEYLRRCLDSVIEQTYKNIEIICVDDGSTDDSGKTLDEYAERDERILVIHKENGGVSTARNAGLKASSGEYIVFVDNDDYIDPDYIETLYQNMDGMDEVVCGQHCIFENGEERHEVPENKVYENNEELKSAYVYKGLKKWFYVPFARIYRRSAIGNLLFEKVLCSEDVLFNLQFLEKASKVKIINYSGYNYCRRLESAYNSQVMCYSPMFEHGWQGGDARMKEELLKWGVSEEHLRQREERLIPTRCWKEICNLLKKKSPYNYRQKLSKIKVIITCKEFRDVIVSKKMNDLSSQGKLAKLCIQMRFSCLVYFFTKLFLFVKSIFVKLFGFQKLGSI